MKKLFKILVIIVVVFVILLIGVQIFLNRGLNPVVQKALPQVSESIGLDLGIESVSINLMGGSLDIKKVSVVNPDGFNEPNVFALESAVLDVHLRALMNGIIQVSNASVKNAKITIVRNAEGDVNLTKIQQQLSENDTKENDKPIQQPEATEDDKPETTKPLPAETEPVTIPKVQVDQLAFNTLFDFVDYKTTNQTPNRLGLDLSIKATDIVTFGARPEEEWGTIEIKGGLHEYPERFVIAITTKVAPIIDSDPNSISFTSKGTIAGIDMRDLGKDVSEEIGLSTESADITLNVVVKNGVFVDGSKFVATIQNAKLAGKLKKKHKKTELPPNLSITIPVSGTMVEPKINIVQAITSSILRNIAKNPDYILDNVTVDGKSLRERLNKALGGKKDSGE